MGIKDLKTFLRKKAPTCIKSIPLKELKGKNIAVDLFTYLYQNLRGGGERVMYTGLVNMVNHLSKLQDETGNIIIYVLDGPNKPSLKSKEHLKRRAAKQSTVTKKENLIEYVVKLEHIVEEIEALDSQELNTNLQASCLLLSDEPTSDTCTTEDILAAPSLDDINLDTVMNNLTLNGQQSVVGELETLRTSRDEYLRLIRDIVPRNSKASILSEDIHNTIRIVREVIEKYHIQTLDIKDEVLATIQNILSSLGTRYVVAPGEGEEYCCHLLRAGHIDTIISKDTDVIAYRGISCVYDLRLSTYNLEMLDKPSIIECLGLESEEMLLEFLILCGCDYNDRLTRVGPVTALKLLLKYRSIAEMQSNSETERVLKGKDFDGLHVNECKSIFSSVYSEDLLIPPCTECNPVYIEEMHLD